MKLSAWKNLCAAAPVLVLSLCVLSVSHSAEQSVGSGYASSRWGSEDGKEDIRVYRDDEHSTYATPKREAPPRTLTAADAPYDYARRFNLSDFTGRKTYLQFMTNDVKPALFKIAEGSTGGSADANLRAGKGLAVLLVVGNWNYHVNYPKGDQGGRSYGVTAEQTGDWSDKTYLNNLDRVVHGSESELTLFYRTLVEVIGKSDATRMSSMNKLSQLVADNFVAIYSAEQYRALVGGAHWDDALLQVTLVAAFHGGQPTLIKYYEGRFTADSFRQAPGVYRGNAKGTPKRAELNDYWQFSANSTSQRSGINLTRRDFEAMGEAITKCAAGNANLMTIQTTVGSSPNVIKGVTEYFIRRKSSNLAAVSGLADAVAAFLVDVKRDAEKITACVPLQAP